MEIKDIAGSLKKGFEAYKAEFAKARGRLKEVQRGISQLLGERRQLQFMQSTRDEFLAAMCAMVDRQAAEGQARRGAMLEAWQLGPKVQKPKVFFEPRTMTWKHVKAVIDGEADFGGVGLPFLMASPPHEWNESGVLVDGVAICTVLGEAIKANLKTYFERVDWPAEPPMAGRIQRTAAIDAELVALRATETELLALIDDNSIKAVEDI